jgi:hypothetical protein
MSLVAQSVTDQRTWPANVTASGPHTDTAARGNERNSAQPHVAFEFQLVEATPSKVEVFVRTIESAA